VTRRVVFRPQAEVEALAVYRWYEGRREGLGKEFGFAMDALVMRIGANPLAFPLAHKETRRAVLSRFPYALYFRIAGEEIVILTVHGRQDPSNWRARS
jgi:hypothetical protein